MKKLLIVLIFFAANIAMAQRVNMGEFELDSESKNIVVKKLSSDKNASSFIIWVKESVKAHVHEHHTECLYVLEGTGSMILEKDTLSIIPGDFITIPENTIHSLKVTSEIPVKVISIQTPEFFGKDRVFIE